MSDSPQPIGDPPGDHPSPAPDPDDDDLWDDEDDELPPLNRPVSKERVL